jgi:hypothetical protein
MTDTVTAPKKDTTYNGWPNYQTWNVMLWMDNEEGAYREYREKVQCYADKKRHFGGVAARAVVEACFGDSTPDGVKLNSSKIRWGRIAEAMREN